MFNLTYGLLNMNFLSLASFLSRWLVRKHPKNGLLEKKVWTYDPAPWILGQYFNLALYCNILIFFQGYHAVGAQVTFSAIYRSSIDDLGMR